MSYKRNSVYYFGKKVGVIAIISNILLFFLKYWAGVVSSSVALVADAWHTISDSLTSLILLAGLSVASKPPDKNHPFGHGRAELVSSFVIGLILFLISVKFFHDSIGRIAEKEQANYGTVAIIVTTISLLVKEGLAQLSFKASKSENSNSLKADGWHHRTDALSSLVLLAGIFLGNFLWWIDGALGIFVASLILYAAYVVINDSVRPLFGEPPSDETVNKIKKIGKEIYDGDLRPHHFHIHSYGNHTEITFHVELPSNMEIREADKIISEYTGKIREQMDIFATIRVDENKNK